ncbi:MAG: DUF3048 C-terminal domain-containing protein [Clostridia bacterium]|nr:DUF3048 C-terminal domain-containing protein [Clostridia bacterium]
MADVPPPAEEPPAPVFYNQLTGLVCDEELSSYRPISICVGNFDGKRQEGLSLADVLVEAPINGAATAMWAIYGAPSAVSKVSSVCSVRDYMLPIACSFGAITAYLGARDGASDTLWRDSLDGAQSDAADAFLNDGSILSTSGSALLSVADALGYQTKTTVSLPYRLAEPNKPLPAVGNRISSVSFSFSDGNAVRFSYDETTRLYSRFQNGESHVDDANGEQLSFHNLLLLFHNVNTYHSPEGTSFSLDATAGGEGFCYTGGGMMRIVWRADTDGNVSFYDTEGEPLCLNRGKTYVGMLRITDSATVIAK